MDVFVNKKVNGEVSFLQIYVYFELMHNILIKYGI